MFTNLKEAMPQPTIITPDLVARVEQLRTSGLGTRRIAQELAISRNTVGKVIRNYLTAANTVNEPLR